MEKGDMKNQLFLLLSFLGVGLCNSMANNNKQSTTNTTTTTPENKTNDIPKEFKQINHPFIPKYIMMKDHNNNNNKNDTTVPTNRWISNLFYPSLNNTAPTNSDPYTLRILDIAIKDHPGVSITQQEMKDSGIYPDINNVKSTGSDYLINGQTVEMRLSCKEWGNSKEFNNNNNITQQVISWDHFGATVRLISQQQQQKDDVNNKFIDFPIARGMAYVTAHYHGLTPYFFTQRAIIHIDADGNSNKTTITSATASTTTANNSNNNNNNKKKMEDDIYSGQRFKIQFNDKNQSTYIIYALNGTLSLSFSNSVSRLVAKEPYYGTIRIAKIPKKEDEIIFDQHKNAWTIGGKVKWKENSYAIDWKTEGQGEPLLYAYPHHIQTLTNQKTTIQLSSATKGKMTALIGKTWTMDESTKSLTDITNRDIKDKVSTWFFPQHPTLINLQTSKEVLENLKKEITEIDYLNVTNKEDNYFSGKQLQKYALLALILNKPNITGLMNNNNQNQNQNQNTQLAQLSLDKIKSAFLVFLENRQKDPFLYDAVYKGIVAKSGLPKSMGGTGNPNAAFGYSYYNDHHYHHGYLIVTAAIIHYLDPNWNSDTIKIWTEALIRDVNSIGNDDYFASYRNWDWFAGHTWAGGIKINGALDGRDQESVSESVNFYWGMKLWYTITNNEKLLILANLQLSIMKRTTYEYFWMLDSNKNRPTDFVKHKVTGILFEQKIDYSTYFGRQIEFMHGIQQLPMTPIMLDYFKTSEFAKEEWDQVLSKVASTVKTSWQGVLYLNYALINSSNAYQLLKKSMLDDGQTRSYSLYLAGTHKNG